MTKIEELEARRKARMRNTDKLIERCSGSSRRIKTERKNRFDNNMPWENVRPKHSRKTRA